MPDLIPPMLKVLATDTTENREMTKTILEAFEYFKTSLADYLHLVVPAIASIIEYEDVDLETQKLALQKLGKLAERLDFSDFASRIVHPIVRVLSLPVPEQKKDPVNFQLMVDLRKESLKTLCALVYQLEVDFVGFIPMVHKALSIQNLGDSTEYDTLVGKLLRNQPLRDDTNDKQISRLSQKVDSPTVEKRSESLAASVIKLKVNEKSLQEAWSVASRKTKEDWVEWIRVFSVRVLQQR